MFTKKLAYPYEYLKKLENYGIPIQELTELSKGSCHSKIHKSHPEQCEIDRTNENIRTFNIQKGRELTEFNIKSDVFLLADIFANFSKFCLMDFQKNPLYNISLPGYVWDLGFKKSINNLERIQDTDIYKIFEYSG